MHALVRRDIYIIMIVLEPTSSLLSSHLPVNTLLPGISSASRRIPWDGDMVPGQNSRSVQALGL
jgi:hypothetical protein